MLDSAAVGPGAVRGRVLLKGALPLLKTWSVTDDMLPFHDAQEFVDESWLVDAEGGLANCVVMLKPLTVESVEAAPLEGATYEKVGPRYEPRVLIVTPGTEVTLRNRNSPCNGFMCRGRFNQFNFTMTAGNERVETLGGRGPHPMQCDLRPYMAGTLFVSTSPYYGLSGVDGRYAIEGVPAGRYRLRLWHEGLGYVEAESVELSVPAGRELQRIHELHVPASAE